MKKILLILIVVGFALTFTSCKKENNNETEKVKKLPSKMILVYADNPDITRTVWTFKYDNQNRWTELTERWPRENESEDQFSLVQFEYDANNRLSKMIYNWGDPPFVITFQYVGNNQIIATDNYETTIYITLNAKGQIISNKSESIREGEWTWEGVEYTESIDIINIEYTYSGGNFVQFKQTMIEGFRNTSTGESYEKEYIDFINYAYSNVLDVFRHTTSPAWIKIFQEFGIVFSTPSRNMPSKVTTEGQEFNFIYETDTDGYVTSSRVFDTYTYFSNSTARVSPFAAPISRFMKNTHLNSPERKSDEKTNEYIMIFEYVFAK